MTNYKRTQKLNTSEYPTKTPYNRKEDIKRLVQIEGLKNCQMWSDKTMKNPLDFTSTPSIPTQSIVVEKIPLSAGVYNMVRAFMP